jgi:hypothetical protein
MFSGLTSFFENLPVPLGGHTIPEVPVLRQMALCSFLQHPSSGAKMEAGLEQIMKLKVLLFECKMKLRWG